MKRSIGEVLTIGVALSVIAMTGSGCGENDSSGGGTTVPACATEYESTFAGIQSEIFDRHGCTDSLCHGSAQQGGLNLSRDVAYENIFQHTALTSPLNLIEPGDEERSYLWLKLAANTKPEQYADMIVGAPMPNNLPALSADELELMRLWIYAGAPKDGVVIGSEKHLNGCLPDPEPLSITPLDPPPIAKGFQFKMPPWPLPAHSEFEGCFATYYDISDQVPAEYLSGASDHLFAWKGFEVRQDPQSHHLLMYYSALNLQPGGIDVNDPSFGTWTCYGGEHAGAVCDPKDLTFCGEGVCGSELVPSFACVGFGPPSRYPTEIFAGAPQAQTNFLFADGVYQRLPTKGVVYWNAHAFNLTDIDHTMNGRVNFFYADNRVYPAVRVSDFSAIFRPNNPPFTKETFCNDHVFPVGSRVFLLFAHTHSHGERYWVTDPDGNQIYEALDYSDPTQQRYDPPLAFDDPNPARRTVRYCAVFNNGVRPDGSPDVERVTRASRVPESAQQFIGKCTPVACVAGKIGAACTTHADCDSAAGAGDGNCDACPITGGESTQNEMFVLFGAQYIDPSVPGADLSVIPDLGEE